ncbi:head-tail joining protein [Salipiger mucosus]|uniref:Uncharacterized protein n=1 Tax=Salipiger mucosus DSM 16094 TaxID=1123237 RepID=S9QR47_9RHOB|nr:hypothetical protein [Salipiger mucosus]EPX82097.1 hypothetical protein Salmuc_02465 [Salipiger mucosus DSM 16094]
MDPFLRSVRDTFRRHGIDATLDPDGAAKEVRLLPTRPDDIADVGSLRIQDATGLFEILAEDFTGFGNGAILAMGAERRKVQHTRVPDPRRHKVLLDTVAA